MPDTTEVESLDGTHQQRKRRLRILALLDGRTLWKKRIAQQFDTSVQTIGRDVEALYDDGLLRRTLVEPDVDGRNHFVGFSTVDAGRQVLDDHLVCEHCGDVVHPDQDCVHEYTPAGAMYQSEGDS